MGHSGTCVGRRGVHEALAVSAFAVFVVVVGFHVLGSLRTLTMLEPSSCDLEQPPPHHEIGRAGITCPTTFVTQYFHIPSKHEHSEYIKWIQSIPPMCLLVFTDSPQLWNVSDQVIVQTTLCSEGRVMNKSQCFWREQWGLDPEAGIHRSFLLYLTWNLKAHFLSEAVRLDPFTSEFFFWMDAGYARVPLRGEARTLVPRIDPGRVHFLLVGRFTENELRGSFHYTVRQDRLAGNMFGGHKTSIPAWVDLYYRVFRQYIDSGWFVGKDQNIMNTACTRHPSVCYIVDPRVWYFGNPWFSMWECLLRQRECGYLSVNESGPLGLSW